MFVCNPWENDLSLACNSVQLHPGSCGNPLEVCSSHFCCLWEQGASMNITLTITDTESNTELVGQGCTGWALEKQCRYLALQPPQSNTTPTTHLNPAPALTTHLNPALVPTTHLDPTPAPTTHPDPPPPSPTAHLDPTPHQLPTTTLACYDLYIGAGGRSSHYQPLQLQQYLVVEYILISLPNSLSLCT
jgi:hypothetical protein